jgi:hypothetical protein
MFRYVKVRCVKDVRRWCGDARNTFGSSNTLGIERRRTALHQSVPAMPPSPPACSKCGTDAYLDFDGFVPACYAADLRGLRPSVVSYTCERCGKYYSHNARRTGFLRAGAGTPEHALPAGSTAARSYKTRLTLIADYLEVDSAAPGTGRRRRVGLSRAFPCGEGSSTQRSKAGTASAGRACSRPGCT